LNRFATIRVAKFSPISPVYSFWFSNFTSMLLTNPSQEQSQNTARGTAMSEDSTSKGTSDNATGKGLVDAAELAERLRQLRSRFEEFRGRL
jgi:hypothetical protein